MKDLFRPEQRRELAGRGFSRRDFGRLAALMTAGAALPFYNEAALAQGLSAMPEHARRRGADQRQRKPDGPLPRGGRGDPPDRPAGRPLPLSARPSRSSRLHGRDRGAARDHVMPFAGSSDPLAPGRAGLHRRRGRASSSPTPATRRASGPPISSAPRRSRFRSARTPRTTSRPWPQADPDAGLIYVCNPNNPTGSVTPKEDIEYLVANKPKGAIVLLDEAYIHLSQHGRAGLARWSRPTRT